MFNEWTCAVGRGFAFRHCTLHGGATAHEHESSQSASQVYGTGASAALLIKKSMVYRCSRKSLMGKYTNIGYVSGFAAVPTNSWHCATEVPHTSSTQLILLSLPNYFTSVLKSLFSMWHGRVGKQASKGVAPGPKVPTMKSWHRQASCII